jgi:hypothetical protein
MGSLKTSILNPPEGESYRCTARTLVASQHDSRQTLQILWTLCDDRKGDQAAFEHPFVTESLKTGFGSLARVDLRFF